MIIEKIKNIFCNDIDYHQNNSKNVINVFTQTITSLNNINSKIEISLFNRNDKISKLQNEKLLLDDLKASNDKVIDKLNKILN